ncbi:MAG: ABC transporter ATP-binding protein [Victivallales bacterium]
MNNFAISTQGLKKKYGWKKEAVKGIDLQVPKGSVYVFLGRNGAGKTTTIKMLMGLLARDSGQTEVLGFDPEKDPVSVRSRVGFVAENQKMYDWMTIGELIWFNKSFYQTWDDKLVDSLLSRFKLTKDLKLKNLSRGMYAQVALILALCQDPELVILDDPISGLDPVVRREFMESIIEIIHEKERTVFFSTHIVNEVEKLADYVGIMHEGNLLVSMPVEELKNNVKKIRMIFGDKVPEDFDVPGLLKKESSGHEVSVIVKDFKKEILEDISNKYKPKSSEIQTLTIEDIFVAMVG